MKKALMLHSWYGGATKGWCPWLKSELENKGYKVWIPTLPTMDSPQPDMEPMLKVIFDKKFVDEDTVVVGHSLGAVLAIRLAERVKFRVGIVLAGWDFDDLDPRDDLFWPNPIDHERVRLNVPTWIVPISENDPYISPYMTERMAERLGGKAIMMGKKGHFTKNDGVTEVREILEFV
jgi:predicted alpha/beta hydrolase family esterase